MNHANSRSPKNPTCRASPGANRTQAHELSIAEIAGVYRGFTFTATDKAGASDTVTARATEVFLRSGSKRLHLRLASRFRQVDKA